MRATTIARNPAKHLFAFRWVKTAIADHMKVCACRFLFSVPTVASTEEVHGTQPWKQIQLACWHRPCRFRFRLRETLYESTCRKVDISQVAAWLDDISMVRCTRTAPNHEAGAARHFRDIVRRGSES